MPLAMANQDVAYTIRKIGGKDEIKRHIENLGFVEGAIVTVISEVTGSLIVNIKDSRVAIGKELAMKITVVA